MHFVYFYVLWVTIQFAFKAPGDRGRAWAGAACGLRSISKPSSSRSARCGSSICCRSSSSSTKLTRAAAAARDLAVGAALEIAPIHTGWTVIDEFAGRFVYFYTGYMLAPHIFALPTSAGAAARRRLRLSRCGASSTACWCSAGYGDLPFVSLALGPARRRRGGRGRGADGAERLFQPLRYLRRATRSSSTSPSSCHGGEPHGAAQDRHHHRPRHHLAAGDGRGRGRARSCCTGGARTRRSASCSCGRNGRSSSRSGLRRCSRRNDFTAPRRPAFESRISAGSAHIRAMPADGSTLERCQSQLQAHIRAMPTPATKPKPKLRRIARHSPLKGRPRLPGRRLGLHLPRLSRAAAADPQVGRPAGQRRARLLQHAVEAAAAT